MRDTGSTVFSVQHLLSDRGSTWHQNEQTQSKSVDNFPQPNSPCSASNHSHHHLTYHSSRRRSTTPRVPIQRAANCTPISATHPFRHVPSGACSHSSSTSRSSTSTLSAPAPIATIFVPTTRLTLRSSRHCSRKYSHRAVIRHNCRRYSDDVHSGVHGLPNRASSVGHTGTTSSPPSKTEACMSQTPLTVVAETEQPTVRSEYESAQSGCRFPRSYRIYALSVA